MTRKAFLPTMANPASFPSTLNVAIYTTMSVLADPGAPIFQGLPV